MSQGVASLHKILKDKTRQKIVNLLATKGSLTYTELMEQLDVLTGILNYHLKVLGDLLQKNESGQYLLTEKGRLASRLLAEFPDDYPNKRKRQKKFWTAAALIQVIQAITVLILYYYNFINSEVFTIFMIWSVGSIFLACLGYKLKGERPPQGSKQEKERMEIVYVLGGGLIGAVIAFFGPPLLSLISVYSGGPNILRLIENYYILEFIIIFIISIILGSLIGYYIGKRNCFQQPKWGKWYEEHIPDP